MRRADSSVGLGVDVTGNPNGKELNLVRPREVEFSGLGHERS